MIRMAEGRVVVNYAQCMACGICVQACPFSSLEMSRAINNKYKKVFPELSSRSACSGCGICATACPLECLTASKE